MAAHTGLRGTETQASALTALGGIEGLEHVGQNVGRIPAPVSEMQFLPPSLNFTFCAEIMMFPPLRTRL